MQVKLLRVLEEGEIVPMGTNQPRAVDVRILAATNRILEDEIARGNFREDLYYRIKGVHVHVPPLMERREDIPLLVHHFIEDCARTIGREIQGINDDAMQVLVAADWPGNVRQLRNVINNMIVMASAATLTRVDIPDDIGPSTGPAHALVPLDSFDGLSLAKVEEYMIRHYLERHEGNRARAAASLGISERTLYRKLKEFGITTS